VRPGGYLIRVLPGELDLDRFGLLAEQGENAARAGQPSVAADRLERALALWRGPALDGVVHGPALQIKALVLEERRLAVAEQWARVLMDMGEAATVVIRLRALAKEHPMRERLWGYLMLALCRSGRPGEALATYAEVRGVLAEELGTEPGPELRGLHQQILQGRVSLV
jgi:DNA-binding SARP family transcriptional activator